MKCQINLQFLGHFFNQMALLSIRGRSRVKASTFLTRIYYLCIHNYIRSLLNIILRPILMVRAGLKSDHSAKYGSANTGELRNPTIVYSRCL